MLTVDFDRFPVGAGNRVLDVGCGDGRHAFEAVKRGADVVAVDADGAVLKSVRDMFAALTAAGMAGGDALTVNADALRLPFPDGSFDRVIAAEVLEHLTADESALGEIARVLAPGGLLAVTVPRWWPERVCWLLSETYHNVDGGHVRIYRRAQLRRALLRHGLRPGASHHAHALHVPYWWLLCLPGMTELAPLPANYHRFLCWQITVSPWWAVSLERLLNPLAGKSLVLYARKPGAAR